MDTVKSNISRGPGLKRLGDSLLREMPFMPGRSIPSREMHFVQSVKFEVGREDWFVLINSLKRTELEDQNWIFEGWIIQKDTEACMTWIRCHGEYSVVGRTGWIAEGEQKN